MKAEYLLKIIEVVNFVDKNKYYIIGVIVLIVIFIFFISRQKPFPFEAQKSIMTPSEKKFFNILRSFDFGEGYYLFSKVRLADIVMVEKDCPKKGRFITKILSKHIDFLFCDSTTYSPLLAIELDDSSHNTKEAKKRDSDKNNILKAAGIPLIRVKLCKNYDESELYSAIMDCLS